MIAVTHIIKVVLSMILGVGLGLRKNISEAKKGWTKEISKEGTKK